VNYRLGRARNRASARGSSFEAARRHLALMTLLQTGRDLTERERAAYIRADLARALCLAGQIDGLSDAAQIVLVNAARFIGKKIAESRFAIPSDEEARKRSVPAPLRPAYS